MGRLKVERSIVQYYLDRLNSLSSIKDFEEKHMFVLNTFLAFQKDGWTVALSPKICYCLEELITHANVECIIVLLKTMSKNWNGVINSKFAYHVLHKALLKCQAMEYHTDELILDYVQSFCAHMKENLSIYIEQQHATHTCRIYPQILAGVLLEKDQISNTYKSAIQLVTPYDENHVVTLTDLCKKFLFTKALKDYVKNENLCPFIQVLLLVASARLSDKFIEKFKKIMKYSGLFSSNTQGGDLDERYLSAYTHPVVTYFAELMVEVMPGAYFADFLNDYILLKCSKSSDGVDSISLADLFMSHSTASRVLRAVIRRLTKPIDIQNFLRVIQSCKDNNYGLCGALSNGQYNVLTELADLCIRHPSEEFQRTFLRVLPKVFGFSEKHIPSSGREDLFIRCLIGMTSVGALNDYLQKNSIKQETVQGEENDNDTTSEEDLINPVTLPGCLFVQTLLKFTYAYPTRIVTSLLTQSSKRLIEWAKHTQLSRVLEATILSDSVASERKIGLLKALMNGSSILAYDVNGSHVIEALWTATNSLPQPIIYKELMAEQLNTFASHLHSHRYGHFVYKKLSLELYKTNKTLWLSRNAPDRLLKKRSSLENGQRKDGSKRARGAFK